MKITRLAAALAVAALALSACGKSVELAGTTPAPAASSTPAPSTSEPGNFPTPDPSDMESDTPTEEPSTPTSIRFGDTWKWDDGVSVTVSQPKRFTPSEWAAGADKYKRHVVFTVTVKNGGSKKLDLLGTPSVSSGDEEASAVFDSAKGLEGSPDTAILPGRTVKFKVGYGVKDPNDIVMEYAPGFDYEDAIFTSK